jgi:phenylacetate-coenzyme A ligase PaaK-like adenylate-forming protein
VLREDARLFIRKSGPPEGLAVTGGSTASPLQMGMNQAERDLMRVLKLGAWQSLGYTPSSRLFLLWGHGHLLGTGWRGCVNRVKRRVADAVLRYRRVDAYRLSREICLEYADQILRYRPVGIIGYASALDLLARYARPKREALRRAGVRFVLSTSEAPPREDSIAVIEDLFGCPVVQEYGGVDIGQVAFNSGRGSFEVYSDLNYVELSVPGGEAILTTLYDRYTPLIRYGVGDVLEGAERLENGHVWRFSAIAGRVNDVLTLPDGHSIYNLGVLHCVHQEPDVHHIQLVVDDDGIVVKLVGQDQDGDLERRIRGRLAQLHPALGAAAFQWVEDVETTAAGKRRWFVDHRQAVRA